MGYTIIIIMMYVFINLYNHPHNYVHFKDCTINIVIIHSHMYDSYIVDSFAIEVSMIY